MKTPKCSCSQCFMKSQRSTQKRRQHRGGVPFALENHPPGGETHDNRGGLFFFKPLNPPGGKTPISCYKPETWERGESVWWGGNPNWYGSLYCMYLRYFSRSRSCRWIDSKTCWACVVCAQWGERLTFLLAIKLSAKHRRRTGVGGGAF